MELGKSNSAPVGSLSALELEIEGLEALARRLANLELLIKSQLDFLTDATSRFLEVERQRGER
jgi:hypothetical protein